jgi:hypothetical protein
MDKELGPERLPPERITKHLGRNRLALPYLYLKQWNFELYHIFPQGPIRCTSFLLQQMVN